MATSLWKAAETVVGDLVAAGIRATMDPRSVNLPAVLVVPPQFDRETSCIGRALFTAFLITRGPGNADAWQSLDALLEQVSTVLAVDQIRPASYVLDDGAPLPALEIQWTVGLSWP